MRGAEEHLSSFYINKLPEALSSPLVKAIPGASGQVNSEAVASGFHNRNYKGCFLFWFSFLHLQPTAYVHTSLGKNSSVTAGVLSPLFVLSFYAGYSSFKIKRSEAVS